MYGEYIKVWTKSHDSGDIGEKEFFISPTILLRQESVGSWLALAVETGIMADGNSKVAAITCLRARHKALFYYLREQGDVKDYITNVSGLTAFEPADHEVYLTEIWNF